MQAWGDGAEGSGATGSLVQCFPTLGSLVQCFPNSGSSTPNSTHLYFNPGQATLIQYVNLSSSPQ